MLPCGYRNICYAQQLSIIRTPLQWLYLVAALVMAFCLPLFAGSSFMTFMVYLGITIISALGLMILSGYCGQFSMGHAAFMMVGAFTTANLVTSGVNFFLALVVGGFVSAGVGIIFGLPSGKVKDFYLVLSTLAAQFIITYVVVGWFNGDVGIHMAPVSIGSWILDHAEDYWYLVLVVLIITTFFAKSITRTKIGRAFVAVRDNDIAGEAMGINTYGYKLLAFAVGCFFAGIAGGLWAGFINFATIDHYSLFDSIWYLAIIFVGGMGTITGVFFGSIFIRGLKELAYVVSPMIGSLIPQGNMLSEGVTLSLPYLFFGIILAVFIIFEPRGLAHRWEMLKASGRLWPWGYW
jgi:branched-chain amino acid transport system permease protein